MDCKECVLASSCAQDKVFCQMDLIAAISDAPYMRQEEPTIIDQYIETHGLCAMARERDKTVITIVLVDGVPIQTPKWMVDIMEKMKESESNGDQERKNN